MNPAPLKLLSVIIPARDEAGCVAATIEHLHVELRLHDVPHEIVVVDDGSTDDTWDILQSARERVPHLVVVRNSGAHGFGRAVAMGIDRSRGDAVVIMMADESDDCRDVVHYWELLNAGYECVFASRFNRGGGLVDYPRVKLLLNRAANTFLRLLFNVRYNDLTNAFKAYRRTTLDGCRPFISPHFNLTVELPLRQLSAVIPGRRYRQSGVTVAPVARNYRSRKWGAVTFSSACTFGWKNISAVAITKRLPARARRFIRR